MNLFLKKSAKKVCVAILSPALLGVIALIGIMLLEKNSRHYAKSDIIKYWLFTRDEIKQLPINSNDAAKIIYFNLLPDGNFFGTSGVTLEKPNNPSHLFDKLVIHLENMSYKTLPQENKQSVNFKIQCFGSQKQLNNLQSPNYSPSNHTDKQEYIICIQAGNMNNRKVVEVIMESFF